MDLYELLKSKKEKLSIIGLGYVGIVLAIEFAKKLDTIGFDINKNKIEKYLNGIDPTNEVGTDELKNSKLKFTNDPTFIFKLV